MAEWGTAKRSVAEGVAFLRSKDSAKGAKGLTQQEAIAESIYALDSSQLDPVSNFSAGSPQYVEAKARARKGQLQQIQSMKESFFGGNGRKGLFDRLREAPPEEK